MGRPASLVDLFLVALPQHLAASQCSGYVSPWRAQGPAPTCLQQWEKNLEQKRLADPLYLLLQFAQFWIIHPHCSFTIPHPPILAFFLSKSLHSSKKMSNRDPTTLSLGQRSNQQSTTTAPDAKAGYCKNDFSQPVLLITQAYDCWGGNYKILSGQSESYKQTHLMILPRK